MLSVQITMAGTRFGFGENWQRFVDELEPAQIDAACGELRSRYPEQSLSGLSFLDAGCGSGLFSLAAARLGAERIVSFDYDTTSVSTTEALKQKHGDAETDWQVMQGDLLDRDFMAGVGQFDIVYCWGVAHHTGAMWHAIENALERVTEGGHICLGIYNYSSEGFQTTERWKRIKNIYNFSPSPIQTIMIAAYASIIFTYQLVVKRNLRTDWLRNTPDDRGMNPQIDFRDWVGGYPFEAATPNEVVKYVTEEHQFRTLSVEAEHPRSPSCVNTYVFTRSGSV